MTTLKATRTQAYADRQVSKPHWRLKKGETYTDLPQTVIDDVLALDGGELIEEATPATEPEAPDLSAENSRRGRSKK